MSRKHKLPGDWLRPQKNVWNGKIFESADKFPLRLDTYNKGGKEWAGKRNDANMTQIL